MSTLAALASVTCGHLLAAGYDAEILAWLPSAANFGKPLEPDFVFSYDEPVGRTDEITEAFPDFHQESLDIWSKELFDLFQERDTRPSPSRGRRAQFPRAPPSTRCDSSP